MSSNLSDVVDARPVDMTAIWVHRMGNGCQECLVWGKLGRPTSIVKKLDEVAKVMLSHHDQFVR